MYEFSSKSQLGGDDFPVSEVVGDTANVRVFKQITTYLVVWRYCHQLLAILQMYEFSSKSQQGLQFIGRMSSCWRYCKCTSFQANHNGITFLVIVIVLLAILQMYEFSSKSQRSGQRSESGNRCWRYCKCTSFQANHNH